MKRFLTTGFLGAFLGIVIGGVPADASLISRGFLDEVLTDYATTTALDLKANKADLTDLSDKIGTLPTELNLYTREFAYMFNDIKNIELPADYPLSQFIIDMLFGNVINGERMPGLQDIIRIIMSGGILNESWGGYMYMGLPDLSRTLGGSYLVENEGYVLNRTEFPFSKEFFPDLEPQKVQFGTSIIEYLEQDLLDIRSPTLAGVTNKLLNGWTDENGLLANPGLKGMYDGWTDSRGDYFPGLYNLSKSETLLLNAYNSDSAYLLIQGSKATTIDGVDYTGPIYPIWKLSEGIDKIGTLPSGSLLNVWDGRTDGLYKNAQRTDTPVYPTSLEEFVLQIYGIPGTPLGVVPSLVDIIDGLKTTANTAKETATAAKTVADANTAKIGTLPTEYATVGAALTAMDAKIDARELPSSSADGQYVLSAKKVGDTITYTWVKMDLTSEEQAQ